MPDKQGAADEPLEQVVFPLDVWGPRFWFTMHTVAMAYPDKPTPADKQHVYNFYVAMAQIIPCPRCRVHFAQILRDDPVADALGSRTEIMDWLWRVHNRANRDNKKRELTRAEVNKQFKRLRQTSGTSQASGFPNDTEFWTGVAAGAALAAGLAAGAVFLSMHRRRD